MISSEEYLLGIPQGKWDNFYPIDLSDVLRLLIFQIKGNRLIEIGESFPAAFAETRNIHIQALGDIMLALVPNYTFEIKLIHDLRISLLPLTVKRECARNRVGLRQKMFFL